MPVGQGLWPAFWLMPTFKGEFWPSTGEIDIMEAIGSDPISIHSTVHYGTSVATHQWKGDSYSVPGGYANDFHTYSCEWQPGKITFYVDGVHFSTRTPEDVNPWPFDDGNKFYIILNLAVGGDWPGPPDESTPLPSSFEVDYVKVYQESPGPSPGGIINIDMDINGGDVGWVKGGWEECFLPCYEKNGCNAFAWSSYEGGRCWLKSGVERGDLVESKGVYSAFICKFSNDKDVDGNDIGRREGKDPKLCCGMCAGLDGCRAWSWSSWNGGTCFFKSGGVLVDRAGVVGWTSIEENSLNLI